MWLYLIIHVCGSILLFKTFCWRHPLFFLYSIKVIGQYTVLYVYQLSNILRMDSLCFKNGQSLFKYWTVSRKIIIVYLTYCRTSSCVDTIVFHANAKFSKTRWTLLRLILTRQMMFSLNMHYFEEKVIEHHLNMYF